MASAKEQAFIVAVQQAQSVRQSAIAAAFVAYGFVQANLATYIAALETADGAFWTSVVAAGGTNGVSPNAVNAVPGIFGGTTAAILT
jgi:hypothetical protein